VAAAIKSLLHKFRRKDSLIAATRETVKILAGEHNVSKRSAFSKLAEEPLAAYERDDGPLTSEQLNSIRRIANLSIPEGTILVRQNLL
jgi:hypothetical protein